jgi:tetratricopeptide (TPR) repeat protein
MSRQHQRTKLKVLQLLDRVAKLKQAGKLLETVDVCRQILAIAPDVSQAWHYLGLAALQQNQPQEALGYLTKAIALAPNNWESHNLAGTAQASLGDYAAGIDYYQRSLKLNPSDRDTRFT